MDKRYNEFKVQGRMKGNDFVITKKERTERDHVYISERDADINNRQTRFNGLHYELVEDVKSEQRKELEAEAKELNIQFRSNIGDEKLQEKINEAKK